MQFETIDSGLWRWTTAHPRWRPEFGGPGGWEQDVASIACETHGGLVVIDPLLPSDPDTVLRFLDERASGRPVAVFLTAPWHERSARAVRDRYSATVWAAEAGRDRFRCEITNPIRDRGEPLSGVVAVPLRVADEGEVAYYLPEHRALVVAEVFIGTDGGLRACMSPAVAEPDEWRRSLEELLALDVERVLPAHGPPVLERGNDALRTALAQPEWNRERPAGHFVP